MPDDHIGNGNAEFLVGNLSKGGFQSLAVILDADQENELAIRSEPAERGFITEYNRQAACDPFRRAMRRLLGVAGNTKANQPAVRLAELLPGAHGRSIDCRHSTAGAFRVIATVIDLAGSGSVRHGRRRNHVVDAHFFRRTANSFGNGIDQRLDCKAAT
jgi:hypothetical protein